MYLNTSLESIELRPRGGNGMKCNVFLRTIVIMTMKRKY
jgi:hypothetical protein